MISAEGGLLAVADSLNNIHIFNLSNGFVVVVGWGWLWSFVYVV